MQEMTINATPESVLGWIEAKIARDFPERASVGRDRNRHTLLRVENTHGFLPESGGAWVANLVLTILSFGLGLIPWLAWMGIKQGSLKDQLLLQAYPADEGDGASVTVDSNRPDWAELVEGWLTARYGEKS